MKIIEIIVIFCFKDVKNQLSYPKNGQISWIWVLPKSPGYHDHHKLQ